MKSHFKMALLGSAIAGALLAIPVSASARDSFSVMFNSGNVAFAYRDGWWDRDHHFHHWRNREEIRWYRHHHYRDYHDWDHDRDRDNGWHDRHDRDWDRDHRPY